MRVKLQRMALRMRHCLGIFVLLFFGNPLLFALFVLWLWIPESRRIYLAFTALLAIIIASGGLVLYGCALAYFRDCGGDGLPRLKDALRRAGRHLPGLALWAVVFALLLHVLLHLGNNSLRGAAYLRSMAPLSLRLQISQSTMDSSATGLFWMAEYYLLPLLLLPMGMQIAFLGFRGASFPNAFRPLRHATYWLGIAALVFLGVWLPQFLVHWRPGEKPDVVLSLSYELTSVILRFLAAYIFSLLSWLLALALTGRILCSVGNGPLLEGASAEDAGDHRHRDAAV